MRKKLFILISILAVLFLGFNAGAATYSDFTSGDLTLSKSGLEPVHNYVSFIQYRQFDFSHANLHDGSGVTNGDVIRLFNITENTYIEEFGIRVTTAAIKSGTSAEIGDGADIDGFVGNGYTGVIPFVDLSTVSSGASRWQAMRQSTYVVSGVSVNSNGTYASNLGPYFNGGVSPYIGPDTIDMTVYVDKAFSPGAGWSGVTPTFEAYIKGFKRVVP